MKTGKQHPYKWLLILLFFPFFGEAQNTGEVIVKGMITNAITNEPLPFVTVVLINSNAGTVTDPDGKFTLTGKKHSNKIKISCIGFETIEVPFSPGKSQTIDIKLKPQTQYLKEVEVKPTKSRYRNKDNPAVALIGQVIAHKDGNRKENLSSYSYEKYEKTQFALSNLTEKFKNRRFLKKFKFIFNNVDTTKLRGKEILPLFLKETLSDFYFQKSPKENREVIKANKMVTFEGYLNNKGMTEYIKYMYQDINIYENDITFLTNNFLSPIASSAPSFYRFFIMDTVKIDSIRCYKMLFAPRNKTDMLFQGFLFITADSNYAVKRIEMSIPSQINLNWAKEVKIIQNFSKIGNDRWMLTSDMIGIDFGLTKDKLGIYGERAVSYKEIRLNQPIADSILQFDKVVERDGSNGRDSTYWALNRHDSLTKTERDTYAMIDSVKRLPVFKNFMNIAMLFVAGYRDLGYFEIGPVNTFYSYNPVEGYRLRVGGRTTDKFSKRVNLETYVAYGFTDQKVKYYLGTTLSLTARSIFDFPVKSLRASIQDETKIPGQELQFVQEDNFLLSFKRGVNNKLFYNKTFRFEYLNEFTNHFSFNIAYQFLRQRPGGDLYFNSVDYLQHTNDPAFIDISEVSLTLRYAPEEHFYQGKQYRIPIANKYPVTRLQLTYGSKYLQNDYDYLNVKLSVSKRFYLSVLGYSDVILEGGKIFGKVPYPLLFIHRANQTYSYQIASYNLMNFLEFVSDEYVSLNIDHCFNGFFFNKIPLIKKLKWREFVTAKVLFGRLTTSNNPLYNPDLFRFPVEPIGLPGETAGMPVTFALNEGPYVEVSAGIGNILKLFRVEFVNRLTYLNHPFVSNFGIRIRFKFDF